jgi:hypothetical protein
VCSAAANALFGDPVGAIGTLQQPAALHNFGFAALHNFGFIVAITAEGAT